MIYPQFYLVIQRLLSTFRSTHRQWCCVQYVRVVSHHAMLQWSTRPVELTVCHFRNSSACYTPFLIVMVVTHSQETCTSFLHKFLDCVSPPLLQSSLVQCCNIFCPSEAYALVTGSC